MDAIRTNHKPSPYLFGAALVVAGFGLWTGRKVAYITSASLTVVAAGWMYRPVEKEEIDEKQEPEPSPPEVELRTVKPPPAAKPLPAAPELHLNVTLANWCIEVCSDQDRERFQEAVEQAVKRMMDGDALGRIVDGETKVLGYGIGKAHKGMAYLWKIEGGRFAEGGIKDGQYLGIQFRLSEALTASKQECKATPLLVGIAEHDEMASASVTSMQQIKRRLTEEKRKNLLLPMEYFFMDDNALLATPCERMDDDLSRVDLTLKQTVSLCLQVAEGVHQLHLLGHVHGDLKPENIVCDASRTTAKLIDFDVSRKASEPPDNVQGMLWYLPPDYLESSGKKDYSLPLDVYSFGVMLHAMVFGRGVEGLDWEKYDKDFAAFFKAYRQMTEHDVEDPWEPLVPFQSFFGPRFIKTKEGARLSFPEKWGKQKGGFHNKHLPKKGPKGIKELKALMQDCMQRNADKRPLMSDVLKRLQKIEKEVE